MNIEIGKTAGFCGGVTNSVNKSYKALKETEKVYCLGELVHNKEVIRKLTEEGLTFIDTLDEVEDNSTVIIRAHGVEENTYKLAEKKKLNLIDLTCPKVLKIHEEVTKYKDNNYFIVLIGNKNHPEVIGTISFCGSNSFVLESVEELDKCLNKIKSSNLENVVIFAQTTFSLNKFESLVSELQLKLNNKVEVKNTICNATSIRQKECESMSKKKDCMIIIGGANSSNTKKLYDIAKENCENVSLIENINDLDKQSIINYKDIGIMAGASTPKEMVDEVIKYLSKK